MIPSATTERWRLLLVALLAAVLSACTSSSTSSAEVTAPAPLTAEASTTAPTTTTSPTTTTTFAPTVTAGEPFGDFASEQDYRESIEGLLDTLLELLARDYRIVEEFLASDRGKGNYLAASLPLRTHWEELSEVIQARLTPAPPPGDLRRFHDAVWSWGLAAHVERGALGEAFYAMALDEPDPERFQEYMDLATAQETDALLAEVNRLAAELGIHLTYICDEQGCDPTPE